jgi:hypothetical protein
MAVLLANRSLGVRHRTVAGQDEHGYVYTSGWGALVGPWPGRAEEGPDAPIGEIGGRTWVLAVDPQAWPVEQGDLVVEVVNGEPVTTWLVLSADLLRNNADARVDYVRIKAHLRTDGTRP